ncbi:MAG TPA: HEAT repeat domain-containing protein [Vicinamibacteria bacterium]|jgi:HEAT repeat protein
MDRSLAAVLALTLCGAAALAAAPPSFEDLVAGLGSPSAKAREESAAALGKSKRREAVAPLGAAVRDPEKKVRVQAVRALRSLGDPEAAAALAGALTDGEPEVRREAVGALVEVYGASRPGPVDRFMDTFSDETVPPSVGPGVAIEPRAQEALLAALRDPDEEVRERAAEALGILNVRSASPALASALLDPAPGVRKTAALALAQVGTAADGKALIPLLNDESAEVRQRALQAVGHLKVREAAPTLRELYEANARKDSGLRALGALSRVGEPAQGELFQQLVQDTDPLKKRLAVEGLARISDTTQLSAFKKDYQREKNEEVKLAYAFALVRLGDRDFVDTLVLNLPSRTTGGRSRAYLLELGPDVLPALYPYLTDPDAGVRAALSDIIGAAGDPGAIPRLTPLLNDPSTTVADRAHLAVERLKRIESAQQSR